jgi:hypothetical protein
MATELLEWARDELYAGVVTIVSSDQDGATAPQHHNIESGGEILTRK